VVDIIYCQTPETKYRNTNPLGQPPDQASNTKTQKTREHSTLETTKEAKTSLPSYLLQGLSSTPKEIFHSSHSLLFSTKLGMHFQEFTLALILDSKAAITPFSSSTALENTIEFCSCQI